MRCEYCGTELRREQPPFEHGDEVHTASRCRDALAGKLLEAEQKAIALHPKCSNASCRWSHALGSVPCVWCRYAAAYGKAVSHKNEIANLREVMGDVFAELSALDAEFAEFAKGSHGHLRVKRALAELAEADIKTSEASEHFPDAVSSRQAESPQEPGTFTDALGAAGKGGGG